MSRMITVLHEDDSLLDGLDKILDYDMDRFIVINNDSQISVIVTTTDIIRAYRKQEKVEAELKRK